MERASVGHPHGHGLKAQLHVQGHLKLPVPLLPAGIPVVITAPTAVHIPAGIPVAITAPTAVHIPAPTAVHIPAATPLTVGMEVAIIIRQQVIIILVAAITVPITISAMPVMVVNADC
jgi:hypothetical protein